jgi:phage-related protein
MAGENVGKAYVEIRADGTKLEQDIKDILRRIEATHPLNLKVNLDVNLDKVKAELDKLAAEHPIRLEATVNTAGAKAELDKLRAEAEANAIHIRAEADTSRAHEEIRRLEEDSNRSPIRIAAEAETESLGRSITNAVENINRSPSSRPTIRPTVDPSNINRTLDNATKKRFVDIVPRIPDDIMSGLKGLGYSIIGAIPAKTITGIFNSLAGNFEANVFKMATAATKFGSIGAEALTLGGDLLVLGNNINDLVGFAALGPASFTALAGTLTVMKSAMSNFVSAASGNGKAMAKLPADVQKIVLQLRALKIEFSNPIQSAFWDNFGVALINFAKNDIPILREAMVKHAKVIGNVFNEIMGSVDKFIQSGQMKQSFDNIDLGIANMMKAIAPVGDALNRLTVIGSAHFPAFGDAIAKAGQHFADFIDKAAKAGKIDEWITNAFTAMDQLGSITKSTVSMFASLASAAERAGSQGLAPLATWMHDMARTMSTDAFQTDLVKLFEKARIGAEALSAGFDKVWNGISKNKEAIGAFLSEAGQVLGQFLDSFSAFFDGNFASGFITLLAGFKTAMSELKPAFKDISNAIGDIGQVAAPMVEATADGFARLMHTVAGVVDALKDGLKAVIPIFNNFASGMISVFSGPLIAAAKVVGDLLVAFSKLPSALQNVIMVAALLAFVLPKVIGGFKDLTKGVGEFFNGVTKEVDGQQQTIRRGFLSFLPTDEFRSGLANIRQTFSDEIGRMGQSWGRVGDAAKEAIGKIGDFFAPLGYNLGRLGTTISNGLKNVFQDMLARAAMTGKLFSDYFKDVGQSVVQHLNMIPLALAPITSKFAEAGRLIMSELQPVIDGFGGLPGKVADKFSNMGSAISGKLSSIGSSISDWSKNTFQDMSLRAAYAAKEIQMGFKDIGESISQHLAMGQAAFKDMAEKIATETRPMRQEIAGIFEDIPNWLTKDGIPVYDWADKAKAAFTDVGDRAAVIGNNIKSKLSDAFDAAKEKVTAVGDGIGKAFSNASDRVGDVASKIGSKVTDALSTAADHATAISGRIGDAFGRASSTISDRFSSAFSTVRSAMGTVGTEIAGTAGAMAQHFAPAVNAVRNLGSSVTEAVGTTVSGMGRIAGAGARAAGRTGMGALSGVVDAMGGPWAAAIGVATTAVTIWAEAQAESAQRTQELAQSLDQQTGALNNSTKKLLAKNDLDGVTNGWDDFVRGFVQNSHSVEETLGRLGVKTKDYNDKIADPKSRDSYVKGIKDIGEALAYNTPITDQMLKATGLTREQIAALGPDTQKAADDFRHMGEKAGNAAQELTNAEKQVRALADATGTNAAQAAILQKNYDTLNSSTSSVGDKFNALKENLETLLDANDKLSKVSKNAERDFGSSTLDFKDSIKSIKEANGGLISNLYDVGTGFDYTNRQSINFSKSLEGQRDAILKLGVEALQKAQQNGASATDAQKAALDAMAPQIGNLENMLKGMGLAQPQIDGIIKSLGLVPDKLVTAIGVQGAEEAQQAILRTQIVAQAFATGHYEAVLAALPDAAKKQIEDATGLAGAFKDGNYSAILNALDMTAGGREAALAGIVTVTNGDYQAPIKAWNLTAPGLNGAKVDIGALTDRNWEAAIKAAYDATNDPNVRHMLDMLTAARTVRIQPVYADAIGGGQGAQIVDAGSAGGGGAVRITNAIGHILMGNAKRFADGGFENHIAQIAKPGITPRVWAEAETGGEAYIPLSISKRLRSTQILEQVAEMFGFTLAKKLSFFDGGILTGPPAPSALSSVITTPGLPDQQRSSRSSFGGDGPSVNVNVYPSQGLSEKQIGDSAARTLYWNLLQQPGLKG